MALMVGCGVLLGVAVVLGTRWHRYMSVVPAWAEPVGAWSWAGRLRELGSRLCVGLLAGLLTGALVVGPGGRLVMRLLAATSPDAQGRITEADEVVGDISLNGTIGFYIFVGLPGGLLVGLLYAIVASGLPPGVFGGALFGLVLLVVFGSRIDPLRPDNQDFDIVGPGLLAVVAFGVLAAGAGAFAATAAGWLTARLPPPQLWWVIWLGPVGLLLLLAMVRTSPAGAALLVGGILAYVASGVLPWLGSLVSRYGRLVMRLLLAVVSLLALPGFFTAVTEIVS